MTASALSFELFPPKTEEQRELLRRSVAQLRCYAPEYFSVTFGAGGSTLDYTVSTVRELREGQGIDAAPHLSCMGGTRAEIRALLQTYAELGCKRIVALRGDLPSGMATPGEFAYAVDLVRFIRAEFGDAFRLEVAAYPEFHPQSTNADDDFRHFIDKCRAGADSAITQYFFNADAYFRFVDAVRAQGIELPIVPGIMPIANFSQLKRFSAMCGAEIPRWLDRRLSAMGDDADAIRAYGADVVADLCRRLLDGGAPGLHVYTLNRARATVAILDRLGIRPAAA